MKAWRLATFRGKTLTRRVLGTGDFGAAHSLPPTWLLQSRLYTWTLQGEKALMGVIRAKKP